jgi:undecaprenyl-diphosphatase
MNTFQAIFLGLVQGLTEFIPVSSSGHLVILQHFFEIRENQLLFNVVLHIGTLIPIFIIFWDDIRDIILLKKNKRKESYYILIGIIPTAVIGILFEDFFEKLFSNFYSAALMLIITGIILYFAEKINSNKRSEEKKEINDLKFWQPLVVGIAQGGAIIPGISRSGTTIAASLFQGLNRKAAARFSFLMSIPVIGGAGFLEFLDVLESNSLELDLSLLIFGFLAASISGYFALKLLLKVLVENKLRYFSYYCWSVAALVLMINLII